MFLWAKCRSLANVVMLRRRSLSADQFNVGEPYAWGKLKFNLTECERELVDMQSLGRKDRKGKKLATLSERQLGSWLV